MLIKQRRQTFFKIAMALGLLLAGMQVFLTAAEIRPGDLMISEFVADNDAGLVDEDGDPVDWIEIYNRSSETVNLGGWALTDDPNQPQKWVFPDMTLGSGKYLLIFASGKNRSPTASDGPVHANFKLNRSGEFLGLYNIFQRRFVDQVQPQPQFSNIAYGRYGSEPGYSYLAHPTPGRANNQGPVWAGLVAEVNFSQTRGFYDAPFMLELSTTTPAATIRYTTDGSEPGEHRGLTYTGPILIDATTPLRAIALKPGFLPSSPATHTYLFANDILTQPPHPPGLPPTWGAHGDDYEGYAPGSPVSADYEMDPEIVNNPRYHETLRDGLTSIPTLSLVMNRQAFAELYANPRAQGVAWERPVSVELFYPRGDGPAWQVNAGLRMQGHASRRENMPKHSFRLFFKREYGPTKLAYPLFPDSPANKFDTLILRGGADRSFAGWPKSGYDYRLTTYTRDEWVRASQIEMSGEGSHGLFVHLYLNGLYWGLYNLVERPDASFMSSYFGGQKEDWYVRNHSGPISGSDGRIKALEQELAGLGGLDNLAGAERYAVLARYLDIPQFIDYVILNWYAGTKDWPSNNWYASVQNPAGQIRFFVWDAEHAWVNGAEIVLGQVKQKNLVRFFFDALLESEDFKIQFADRVYKHLYNDGALTDANAQARWLQLNNNIQQAIPAESARWGDARYDDPITPDDWRQGRDAVLAQMEGNAARLVFLLREAGYYPPVDPPAFNQQGGLAPAGFKLTMNLPPICQGQAAGECTIYYTVDGSDPRSWGAGGIAPGALIYESPLVLTGATHIKARVLVGEQWSALNETTFKVMAQDRPLRITEIMYNPPGPDELEFIELKNTGHADINLSNMTFAGIRYTFFPHTRPLAPGEFLVLVRDRAAFAQRYPGVPVGGEYGGQLSNKGEKITLTDSRGEVVISVEYSSENGWPISPDGRGDSLVLARPNGDPDHAQTWRASLNLGGSPGVDEPGP